MSDYTDKENQLCMITRVKATHTNQLQTEKWTSNNNDKPDKVLISRGPQTPLLYKTHITKIIPENRYFQSIDLDYMSTKYITHMHTQWI